MQKDGDWHFPTHGENYKPALTKNHDETKWTFGVFFSPGANHIFGCEKKKKSKISIVGHLCGGEEFWP